MSNHVKIIEADISGDLATLVYKNADQINALTKDVSTLLERTKQIDTQIQKNAEQIQKNADQIGALTKDVSTLVERTKQIPILTEQVGKLNLAWGKAQGLVATVGIAVLILMELIRTLS